MATMKLYGIDCDILYVDSGASGSNDGSTPANALTSLPAFSSLAANTVYIVRRNNTQSVTSGSLSVNNVAVIGMPKSTDDLYRLVPSAAKTAWDADVEERFIWEIPDSTTASNDFTGDYFTLHRVDVQTVGTTNVDLGGDNWDSFHFIGNNIRLTNTKFSMKGVDLNNYQSTEPSRGQMGSISIDGNYFYIDDFNYEFSGSRTYSYNDYYSGLLRIEGAYGVITNSDFKGQVAYAIGSQGYFITVTGDCPFIRMENITMTTYVDVDGLNSSQVINCCFPAAINLGNASDRHRSSVIKNINYTFGGLTGTSKAHNQNYSSQDLFLLSSGDSRGMVIQDITIDYESNMQTGMDAAWSNGTGYLLEIDLDSEGNSVGYARPPKIENISVKSSTIDPQNAIKVERIPQNSIIKEVVGWTYSNKYGFYGDDRNGGSNIESGNFKGKVQIGANATRVNITNWEVSDENSPQFRIIGDDDNDLKDLNNIVYHDSRVSALVVIQNATVPPLQVTDMFDINADSMLLIENLNTTPVYDIQGRAILMVNSEQGVSGNWRCATEDMLLKSVNVQRTGGSTYAIRGNATGPNYVPAWMGTPPFKGLVRTPAQVGSTGSRTMTLYGAYKGFITDPRPDNIFVHMDIPSGGTGTERKVIDTRAMGYSWESDNSSWTGDSGLTTIKMVIPFEYDRSEDIEIRIGAYWNEPGSYFYIDPTPVFA